MNDVSSQHPARPAARAASVDATICILCGGRTHLRLFRKQGYDFLRCQACSLVRLDPVPDERALAEVYERSYADGPYKDFAADQIRLAHAEVRVKLVAPHAPEGPWLDVGCSSGAFLQAASRQGIDIDGFDISSVAVEIARSRGLSAFHAAAETFQPTRRYAYITGFDVLEHVVDPGAFLDRAREWLRPDGRIALTVPNIDSPHARLMGRFWYYYAAPLHITYFNRDTATRLLQRHRFWPISISNAPKVMTVDYIASQLAHFNPWLHRASRLAARLLPPELRRRELPIPTGEILLVASA